MIDISNPRITKSVLDQEWRKHRHRLVMHYRTRAADMMERHGIPETAIKKWLMDADLDEPMYPTQEYANNH